MIAGEDLKKQGFGGLYAVGRAAACEPLFVVLSHTPSNATETLAWVGKGIVYDTGGLCIKGRVREKFVHWNETDILNDFVVIILFADQYAGYEE